MTEALWLARYRDVLPVRSRGSFHVVSAVRAEQPGTIEPRRSIVVFGSRIADPRGVRRALRDVADAHGAIVHPRIPRVVELAEHADVPFLELDCDAVLDGNDFLRMLADARQRLTYGQGDALFTQLREALQAAHRVTDPRSGRPYCLGRVGYANILISRAGKFWFVGFGHNFPVAKEDGRLEGHGSVWQAPEVLAGAPPTPSSDYVSVLMIARSLTAFADMGEIVQRFLQVAVSPESLEAYEIARWFESQFITQRPDARPPIEEGIARSARIREILGVSMDRDGLEARAASIIADADGEVRAPAEGEVITVAPDGEWVQVGEAERHKLGRANQQVLRALLLSHRHEPGRGLGVWQLLEAGWPGEDPIPEAGANRVYASIARLRAIGLRNVIQRHGEGYRIAPGAPLKVAGRFPF